MKTVTYIDGGEIKVRIDGYISLNTLQTCLYGKGDPHFPRWTATKEVVRFIENLARETLLSENVKEFVGVYRGKTWDENSAAKGVLEYYDNDGENRRITFIHKKLAYYYAISKNPIFASWLMDVADRYLNGDLTLAKEVIEVHDKKTNQVSSVTVTSIPIELHEEMKQKFDQLSKENQVLVSKNEEIINERKRKFEDIEYESKVIELDKLKESVKKMSEETKKLSIENKERETKLITSVFNDYKLVMSNPSEREQLHLRDIEKHIFQHNLNNTMNDNVPLMITQGTNQPTTQPTTQPTIQIVSQVTNEISIPLICQSMKLKPKQGDYGKIGKIAAKLYRERYPNTPNPPKGKQFFDGKVIEVNTYYEKDRDILEKAINQHFNKSL